MMTNRFYFLFLLFISLLVSGCRPFGNDPKPVSTSEKTVDINIVKVIRSGEFEERVETEVLPQNNCDNKSAFSFSVNRERTLEQSVDLTIKAEGGGELELAGKPMEVGAAGKIIAAVGVEYGQSSGLKVVDSGGMNFNIEAGDFPNYTIVWREKWERGYITVQYNGEEIDIPYLYLTTARPELVKVEYNICPTNETPQTAVTSIPPIQPTEKASVLDSEYDGWVICWHGRDGYEYLIAYPEDRVRTGLDFKFNLKNAQGRELELANDSLKMCYANGQWYGYPDPNPWFPKVSYVQLGEGGIFVCSDSPGCQGDTWTLLPEKYFPSNAPELQLPTGTGIQVITYKVAQ